MGVHAKEREFKEIKEQYIKKSSAIMLVLMALAVGAFAGNAVTMVYVGQQQRTGGAPVAQQGRGRAARGESRGPGQPGKGGAG